MELFNIPIPQVIDVVLLALESDLQQVKQLQVNGTHTPIEYCP